MKKIIFCIFLSISLVSCNFLETPPAIGLTEDKLVDLKAMRALVNGAYSQTRYSLGAISAIDMLIVRDMSVRNKPEWDSFFEHKFAYDIYFGSLYSTIGVLNTVAVHDVQGMEGSQEEKDVILGEMSFLRSLYYFLMNTHYELPSTGWSGPMPLKPVQVGERLSCAKASDIRSQIEKDIEQARLLLKDKTAVLVDYYAATALAARIYFYHKNYIRAYECANEVINSNKYALEDIAAPFSSLPGARESIFVIPYNSADNVSPLGGLYQALQASDTQGSLYVNSSGELKRFFKRDDKRYQIFFKEQDNVIYGSGKYAMEKMDYPYIRLGEMYLIRSEANIMNNGSVMQQDVDDLNLIIGRAIPSEVLNDIPSKDEMLEILYRERTREMALEVGDHFLNVKRLQYGIVSLDGDNYIPYSEYADNVVSIFPELEKDFHNLERNK